MLQPESGKKSIEAFAQHEILHLFLSNEFVWAMISIMVARIWKNVNVYSY